MSPSVWSYGVLATDGSTIKKEDDPVKNHPLPTMYVYLAAITHAVLYVCLRHILPQFFC